MSAQVIDLNSLPEDAKVSNDQKIEEDWAEYAFKFAETFEMLLKSIKTKQGLKQFKFTPQDDLIYTGFRKSFPNLSVQPLDVKTMKDKAHQLQWYQLLEAYKTVVTDYNHGSIVRVNSMQNLGPENGIIVPRIQFYMIELARCREGCNDQFVGVE
ncbi:Polysaccharide biosynthesis family protein [Spironucleus salmonicida]|uniref:Polysaccharide biosynthesis family protein n=1 Tax=Spironucleus salmonicida TaxID=348837 RepID=V6LIY4_9EUKA|nr:Polysaccharide biosynthesis protein [Spironucleus salmonicida]KAH0570987.1 Polysaccharide biosynthesis family protein [Spironucleus salmonicida]|eukprot:EST44293.1 hypothetical protein SS50377_15827 [Spironucleus salmonicida]